MAVVRMKRLKDDEIWGESLEESARMMLIKDWIFGGYLDIDENFEVMLLNFEVMLLNF